MKRERRICCQCDSFCLAPAGYRSSHGGVSNGKGSARHTCHSCGDPVCANCSLVTTREGKRVRLCHSCYEREVGNSDRVMAHLHKLAGY